MRLLGRILIFQKRLGGVLIRACALIRSNMESTSVKLAKLFISKIFSRYDAKSNVVPFVERVT